MPVDFYSLLCQAVVGLPENNSNNRASLYVRARNGLVNGLNSTIPSIDDATKAHEQRALEDAINRVEAENLLQGTAATDTAASILLDTSLDIATQIVDVIHRQQQLAAVARADNAPLSSYSTRRLAVAESALDLEAVARGFARRFIRERDRCSLRPDQRSEQASENIDFFSRTAAGLNNLADAIAEDSAEPQAEERILSAEAETWLRALAADFYRFISRNSDTVYPVGLIAGMAAFLGLVKVGSAAEFVSELALGRQASRDST